MTREEAIKYLIHPFVDSTDVGKEKQKELDAYNMAIKALEQEPYFWEKCPYYEPDIMFDGKDEYDMGKCTYKQEPKTGHWIEKDGFDGDVYYDCSECGESFCLIDGTPTDNLYNYCPNCGAKMKGESE